MPDHKPLNGPWSLFLIQYTIKENKMKIEVNWGRIIPRAKNWKSWQKIWIIPDKSNDYENTGKKMTGLLNVCSTNKNHILKDSRIMKSESKKMRHVKKLAISKKSTFFALSSWDFVKMITSWDDFSLQVSWW